ncbi:MAG: hypothetical protein IPN98_12225 [Propionivibrio sp.]|nr:hypothetical protein [Propionivibrio sp.]
MDHLIVTRQSYTTWALSDKGKNEAAETYFFNDLPEGLFEEFIHNRVPELNTSPNIKSQRFSGLGINLD